MQPHHPVADPHNRVHVVRDEEHGEAALPELGDLLQTALLKRLIADGENLVGEEDLRVHVDGHRERQAQIHPARVVPERAVHELLDFREREDVLDAALRLGARDAEDRRVHQDVVVRGRSGSNPAPSSSSDTTRPTPTTRPVVGCDHPRQDLQQGRLAGAVRTDHAEDGAGLDAEPHVAKRPEVARPGRRVGVATRGLQAPPQRARRFPLGFTAQDVALPEAPRRPDYPWIIGCEGARCDGARVRRWEVRACEGAARHRCLDTTGVLAACPARSGRGIVSSSGDS